jgi:hypothetical protein
MNWEKSLGLCCETGDKVHDRFEPSSQLCWSDKTQCIFSKRAPNRTSGSKRARNVVGNTFHPSFVHVSGGNSAIAQQHLGKRKAQVGAGSGSGGYVLYCCVFILLNYI